MSREPAKQFFDDPIETVKEAASTLSDRGSRQRETAARGLRQAATVLHDNAGKFGGGRASSAAHRVADGIDSTATYLEDHDLSDMKEDMMQMCRRYPAQSLLSALAIGFLLGRALRR